MPIDQRVAGFLGRVLDDAGYPIGTCFQIVPGVAVTAWHVLDALGTSDVGASVQVDPLQGGDTIAAQVATVDPIHDLAVIVLMAPLSTCAPRLVATDDVQLSTPVSITGVPAVVDQYTYRFLNASGLWAGGTSRDDEIPMGRLTASSVMKGMSGAPVMAAGPVVVGVVAGRYNSDDGWLRDSVWVARTENLLPLLVNMEGLTEDQLLRISPTPRRFAVDEMEDEVEPLDIGGDLIAYPVGRIDFTHLELADQRYRSSAERGDIDAMNRLGAALWFGFTNRHECDSWFRGAAEAGHLKAMVNLGFYLNKHDEADEAEEWYRRSANAGYEPAMNLLGGLLLSRREIEEATKWFRKSAEGGLVVAMMNMGLTLAAQQKLVAARRWYAHAATHEFDESFVEMAVIDVRLGDLKSAASWHARASSRAANSPQLWEILHWRGLQKEAELVARQAVETGDPAAADFVGQILENRDEIFAAEKWYRARAEHDLTITRRLADFLARRGDYNEAELLYRKLHKVQWVQPLVNRGTVDWPGDYRLSLAWLLHDKGDDKSAIAILQQNLAIDGEHADSSTLIGWIAQTQGKMDLAEEWFRRGVGGAQGESRRVNDLNQFGAGSDVAAFHLAEIYSRRPQRDSAHALYLTAAVGGHRRARAKVSPLPPEHRWLTDFDTRGLPENGGEDRSKLAEIGAALEESGVLDEASLWYLQAAKGRGDPTAMTGLGWLTENGQDVEFLRNDPLYWYQRGALMGSIEAMTSLDIATGRDPF